MAETRNTAPIVLIRKCKFPGERLLSRVSCPILPDHGGSDAFPPRVPATGSRGSECVPRATVVLSRSGDTPAPVAGVTPGLDTGTHLDESDGMDSTTRMGLLLGLAGVIAREDHADPVIDAALPVLLAIDDVAACLVVRETTEGPGRRRRRRAGRCAPADLAGHWSGPPSRSVRGLPGPAAWAEQGVTRVTCRRLAGHVGVLVLGREWSPAIGRRRAMRSSWP